MNRLPYERLRKLLNLGDSYKPEDVRRILRIYSGAKRAGFFKPEVVEALAIYSQWLCAGEPLSDNVTAFQKPVKESTHDTIIRQVIARKLKAKRKESNAS